MACGQDDEALTISKMDQTDGDVVDMGVDYDRGRGCMNGRGCGTGLTAGTAGGIH